MKSDLKQTKRDQDPWQDIAQMLYDKAYSLPHGCTCFELIKVIKKEYVDNDNKLCTDKYLRLHNKERGVVQSYILQQVHAKIYHYPKVSLEGKTIKLWLNDRILLRLGGMRLKMTDYNLKPVPELVLVWKPQRHTIKYTFIYKKDWSMYKDYIKMCDKRVLKYEFYWNGTKEWFNEIEWIRWYKDPRNIETKYHRWIGQEKRW